MASTFSYGVYLDVVYVCVAILSIIDVMVNIIIIDVMVIIISIYIPYSIIIIK